MLPTLTVRAPDGSVTDLVHGDLIGRVFTSALHIDDGRISEAHALVSLRHGQFHLLALRGAFAVSGKLLDTVVLEPGTTVQLARGLSIEVLEVHLPDEVLGVEGPGLPRQALPSVATVLPGPRLVAGWREEGLAWTWATGEGIRLRLPDAERRTLAPGDRFHVDGVVLRAVSIPLVSAGNSATRRQGSLQAPLTLVAHYDTVHLLRDGRPPVPFSGKQARLISELVAVGTALSWRSLAQLLWPDEEDPHLLRSRLDVVVSRIRRKLRARGVRSDLVRPDGAGNLELLLYANDRVRDNT